MIINANLGQFDGFCQARMLGSIRLFYVSPNEIILYVGVPKNGLLVMIFYHIHLIEKTTFLQDMFCKTKLFRALKGNGITDVAIALIKM